MKFSINSRIFNYIASSSHRLSTDNILFTFKNSDELCLGFVVPKAMGSACLRNKFKRRCRAAFEKLVVDSSFPSVGVIVKPRSIDLKFSEINQSFNALDNQISNTCREGCA